MDNNIVYEAISILQCCEDASTEKHIKTALGVAIGMLLSETDYNQLITISPGNLQ